MSVCENTKVNADQTLTRGNASTAELIKQESVLQLIIHRGKHGEELTENGIVITAIADSKPLQNNRNERMQIDSSIKENTLDLLKLSKNEQVDAHGVPTIFLMVHANLHNFITLVNTLMMIHWLTLLNYVIVATQRKPINREKINPEENFINNS